MLIGATALAGLSGRDTGHFRRALVPLGLRWNFGFVALVLALPEAFARRAVPA